MTPNWVDDLLGFLVPSLPLALVWLGGCFYALGTYRKHRAVSTTAFLGCFVLCLSTMGGSVLTWWMFEQRKFGAWTTPQLNLTLGPVNLARGFLTAGGYLLLLVAIFGWRAQRPFQLEKLEEYPSEPRPRRGSSAIRQASSNSED